MSKACPAFASTGGDPVGTWNVTESCQVPYARTTTPDWCSQLVYGGGTVKDGLFLGQDFIPVKTGGASFVTYTADPSCTNDECGTYSAMLVFENARQDPNDPNSPYVPTTTNFPLGCLQMHTPNPTCAELQKQIIDLAVNVLPMVDTTTLSCVDDGNQGCNCSYVTTTMTITPDVGSWRVENNLLVHYPSLPNLAPLELADFEVSGNNLALHGHAGVPLLAHDPLRSLTLTRKN